MISLVSGTVHSLTQDRATILTSGGVGYELSIPASLATSLKVDQTVSIQTWMGVKEDAITLYGFSSSEEKALFLLLMKVSGIGAKIALAAVGTLNTQQLGNAIAMGDIATIQRIPGVGKKVAEKIALELKDKVTPAAATSSAPQPFTGTTSGTPSVFADAVQGLIALGLRREEADSAARRAMAAGADSETSIIREVLRQRGHQ